MNLYEPPIVQLIAGALVVAGACAAIYAGRLIARGLRLARPLDLVLGIRVCVLALVAGLGALGLLSGHMGFLIVGALILAEELYETGTLAAIIRRGEPGPEGERQSPTRP